MKFEDGLLLDHHPGDPCIGHGQQHEQANDGTIAKGEELRVEFVLNNSIDGTGLDPEIDEIYSFSRTVQKGRTEKDT